jgi:hypothetical protein
MKLFHSLLFVFAGCALYGQISDSLTFYADIMRHADLPEHRVWAARAFQGELSKDLKEDLNFEKDFSSIDKWVMFLYSKDSTLRVITWQVNEEERKTYQGMIQRKGQRPVSLEQGEVDLWESEYEVLVRDNWIGLIYYDMVEDRSGNLILFGYADRNDGTLIKVAEPLVEEDGDWYFGGEVFYMDENPIRPNVKNRIFLQYSNRAAARLTYDRSDNLIFFDHLIPLDGMEDEGTVMVPDGSYSAFKMKKGKWVFVEKLFDQVSEEPPMDDRPRDIKRDVFGNPVSK